MERERDKGTAFIIVIFTVFVPTPIEIRASGNILMCTAPVYGASLAN